MQHDVIKVVESVGEYERILQIGWKKSKILFLIGIGCTKFLDGFLV